MSFSPQLNIWTKVFYRKVLNDYLRLSNHQMFLNPALPMVHSYNHFWKVFLVVELIFMGGSRRLQTNFMKNKRLNKEHLLTIMGDSMKMGNTFWPNLAMKTWFFTHVLDRSPQNAYMPCEFWLAVRKQIVEYYVGFMVIFLKKYSDVI